MIYFTADTHFGYANAVWMCGRPYPDVEVMNEAMIAAWNERVHALTLCHYPMLTWKHARRSYMIHGHIHADTNADFWSLIRCRDNVLNAGVDLNGYHPVTFDELVENNRKFKTAHEEERDKYHK